MSLESAGDVAIYRLVRSSVFAIWGRQSQHREGMPREPIPAQEKTSPTTTSVYQPISGIESATEDSVTLSQKLRFGRYQ